MHTSTNASAREIFSNYKYQSKWGGRTESLLDTRAIETYVYNAFGKGVGGGVRFNDAPYYDNMNLEKFQHGNKHFGMLAFTSYLEMLNNSRTMLVENPYHFPTGSELYRRPFWADFRQWVNFNYTKIYEKYLKMALGDKPIIGEGNKNKTNAMNTKNLPEPRTAKPQGITEAQIRADYADVRARVAAGSLD